MAIYIYIYVGNDARFINHSCDPNCKAQKEHDDEHPWVGVYALRYIPAGSELTIHYHYATAYWGREWVCKCGSDKCISRRGEYIKIIKNSNIVRGSVPTHG